MVAPAASRQSPALAALIVLAGVAVYANALNGPFVYDDRAAVVDNPAIRSLPPSGAEAGADQTPLAGRPVVAWTIALNYAMSGLDVRGYHVGNVLIHLACALALFGVVRRTLLSPRMTDRWGESASGVAFATALLWTVHPLCTEAVNYTVQRTESLMALFCLLTLYCALRARVSGRAVGWGALAVLACALGMASKESMVTCPVIVLLHDLAYARGGAERRARVPLYIGLASTWLLLAWLMFSGPRSHSVGWHLGTGAWDWLKNQSDVIVDYLRHAVWPVGLVFDYGYPRPLGFGEVAPRFLTLAVLATAALWGFLRRPTVAFPAVAFFVILAPTSSVVPIVTEVGAERRMYLPLAALVVLAVAAVHVLIEMAARRATGGDAARAARITGVALLTVVTLALGAGTVRRNTVYGSRERLWRSAVEAVPDNARAQNGLGRAILDAGRPEQALEHLRRALELDPDDYHASYNMGLALKELGHFEESVPWLERAALLRPERALPRFQLGSACLELGWLDDAERWLGEAIERDPDLAGAHADLAIALARLGQVDAAIESGLRAIAIDPDLALAHNNLGILYLSRNRLDEAIASYRRALELDAAIAEAHSNLGIALAVAGRREEAIEHVQEALRLEPEFSVAHRVLGTLLAGQGRRDEGIAHLREALRLDPDDEIARAELERLSSP